MMKVDDILDSIFGTDILENFAKRPDFLRCPNQARGSRRLRLVKDYIEMSMPCKLNNTNSDDRNGRTGLNDVNFSKSMSYGNYVSSPDQLSITSLSALCSAVATAGVYKGKWMYEVIITTAGPIQLGWGTRESKFTDMYGVGETIDSYSYNGYTQRKFHITSETYGVRWSVNDFIGCAIDLDERTMNFYRNGRDMGLAFENISINDDTPYHPIVTLIASESVRVNFGSLPFRYPINGYQPLQAAPSVKYIQTSLCLQWLTRVINFIERLEDRNMILEDSNITVHGFLMALASIILRYIASLLTIPYITVSALIPFMEALYITEVPNPSDHKICNTRLIICMDIFWTFLEESELYVCYEIIISYIISTYVYVTDLSEYSHQCRTLALLIRLCQHDATRRYFIQKLLFNCDRLPRLLYVRPLNNQGLSELLTEKYWWNTYPLDPSIDRNKEIYKQVCQKIEDVTCDIESLGLSFIITLLNDKDEINGGPTSRTIFLNEFRKYVRTFMLGHHMQSHNRFYYYPILSAALSTCFNLLIGAVQYLWKTEASSSIQPHVRSRLFYDETINYDGIERLGGDLSYLKQMYKTDLIQKLGPHHTVIVNMKQKTSRNEGNSSKDEDTSLNWRCTRSSSTDVYVSVVKLLDSIILFYSLTAKKYLSRLFNTYVIQAKYAAHFDKMQKFLKFVENNSNNNTQAIKEQLLISREAFKTHVEKQTRYVIWIQANVLTKKKYRQLTWLLRAIILTVFKANDEAGMLKFMPNYYLTTIIEMWSVVCDHISVISSVEEETDYQAIARNIATVLCELFLDPRVMQMSTRDMIYTTLGRFVGSYQTMKSLESIPITTRRHFVIKLLTSFDSKDWPKSNVIIVHFWRPNGFAFRCCRTSSRKYGLKFLLEDLFFGDNDLMRIPVPSSVFQKHIMDLLHNNSLKTKFLKTILNRVNWSFSEFMNTVAQVSRFSLNNGTYVTDLDIVETCATSFTLTISALRTLEMVCFLIPLILNDWNEQMNKILVEKLCSLLSQLFHRILSPTSRFRYLVEMNIPDLSHIHHFPILTAAFGVLLSLIKQEMNTASSLLEENEVPKITRSLLIRSSFRIEYLDSLLAMECTASLNLRERFSLTKCPQNIAFWEMLIVEQVIEYLKKCHILLQTVENPINEENICTICYALEISVRFEPCSHSSCHYCIDQHLLNNRRCFFCKELIHVVRDFNGKMMYEFSNDHDSTFSSDMD